MITAKTKQKEVFKLKENYLISNLHGTDREFPAYLWCQILEQIELQVNLIRPSRINPSRSVWEELHGNFDFNATPLALLGTKRVIYMYHQRQEIQLIQIMAKKGGILDQCSTSTETIDYILKVQEVLEKAMQ